MKRSTLLCLAVSVTACAPDYAPEAFPSQENKRVIECPPVLQPTHEVRLRVTGDVHVLASGPDFQAELPIELLNGTGQELGLHQQQDHLVYALEKWVHGEWSAGWSSAWTAALTPAVRVCAGGRMTDVLKLWATTRENHFPQFETEPYAGDYRVVLLGPFLGTEPPVDAPGPLRFSEPFRLE